MNKKSFFYKSILLLLFSFSGFAASLGFEAPNTILLPGELFTNNIVINYNSSDSIPTGLFLNVQWESDTVEIRTALWNNTDFEFSNHSFFNTSSNQYSNVFLYSSCAPSESSWNNNTNLTIVKLICVIVGREICNFEFNGSKAILPFPTSACDITGKDILGESDIWYDGFDVLPIVTRSAAGYKMSAGLSAGNVAIIYDKTNFAVNLLIKDFGKPLDYEHIRATLDYDESIIECNSNLFEVQPWLEDVQLTIKMVPVIQTTPFGTTTNLEPFGTLIFEAKCPLTNFTGKLVEIHFKPTDYDESEFEFDEWETFVNRNDVNLLGYVDEDDDGLENSIVYILSSGQKRYILKMQDRIGKKDKESKATLFLTSEISGYIDDVEAYVYFNTNKIVFSDDEDFAFKLNPDFTNSSLSTFSTEHISNTTHLYNQAFGVSVSFDDIITIGQNQLIEIGEITWTNLNCGVADFFVNVDDSYIEYDGINLIDAEKQLTEFPASMQIIESGEISSNIFSVNLIPTTSTNYVVQPGQNIELNICGISQNSVTGFGKVIWRYNHKLFRAVSFPPNVWTNKILLKNGSITSDVFGIKGEFLSAGNNQTTVLSKITFQALEGQSLYLEPLREHSQVTNNIGTDIIGSADSTNDGVFGTTIVAKEPVAVFMMLKSKENLFAGKFSEFVLELLNPSSSSWTNLRAELEIADDEILITNKSWNIKIDEAFPNINIEFNEINKSTNIYQRLIITPSNSFISVFTSVTMVAILQLSSTIPITTSESEILGSFCGMPLEDEIMYEFYTDSSTGFYDLTYVKFFEKNIFNEDMLSDSDTLFASPSGVKVWIKADTDSRPLLQTSYTMHVYVDNPNNVPFNRVTLAWSYNAENFEVLSAEKSEIFDGNVWIENNDDGDGYLCADLTLPHVITNSEIEVLTFSILPKLTEDLELEADEIEISETNEIIPGVWNDGFNLLETIDDDVYDNYQEWIRGIELTQAPLLCIWDIDDLVAGENILNLKDSGTGLDIYKVGVDYKWWASENNNINIEFNSQSMLAKIFGKENWTGQEIFWIYCQNMNNGLISKDSVKIDVHNPNYEWNEFAINIEREDYFTITGVEFSDLAFNIINPPENYTINAFIIENGNTNSIVVEENNGTGHLEWETPSTAGIYYGKIVGTNTANIKEVAHVGFSIKVLDSYTNIDPTDGDRFEVKYNNLVKTLPDPTRIQIKNGNIKDKLTVKVWKNDATGDGIVNFDEIISDSGIKSISLEGSVNLIQTEMSIGSIKVKRGIVGEIISKKGEVKSVVISTAWNKEDEEFFEVGLTKGLSAFNNIGTIKILGGNIGVDDEPAIISSANGNIKTIITKMKKKIYFDGPNIYDDVYIETAPSDGEGANIFANIYAPNGEIGSIIAVGGKVGSLSDDAVTEIYSGNNIKKISAIAKKGDFEIIGGFIHSDIYANGDIGIISAIGGDICGSEDSTDTEGGFDETELIEYPVVIHGNTIKNISAFGKSYGFRDGPTADDAYKEIHGGNISSFILLQNSLGKISTKTGNMSVYLKTHGDIMNIQAKSAGFKSFWDEPKIIVGGNILFSIILPNTKYQSAIASDYKNKIKSLKVSESIKESWIGEKGPAPDKFIYKSLINSEIWIDGQKYK